MVNPDHDILDTEISNLINKLIRFIGQNEIERCLRKYKKALELSGPVFRDYYLKTRHPWWKSFLIYFDLIKKGKSIKNNIIEEVIALAGDAKKISIIQKNMPERIKHNFKKNLIDENRAYDYLFEIQVAWHFYLKGCEIQWHDDDSYRHSEFLVKSPELEFNVECKRISVDISRRIRRRDFYRFAEKLLPLVEKKGYSGFIDINLSDRFHSNDSHLTELTNQVINQINAEKLNGSFTIPLGSVSLDLGNDNGVIVDPYESLKILSERKSPRAHGVILFKSKSGSPVDPIQMTLMSEQGDKVLNGIKDRILKAKDQLQNSKPGLICCFLQDIDDYELKMLSNKSGLQIMTSNLLFRDDFNHIAAISYCSENVIKNKANMVTHSNLGLIFRNDNCKFDKVKNYEFLAEINE